MEKKYLSEFKISMEFLEVSEKNLEISLRTSANRLYFSFEKAVVSYLLFKGISVPKNHQKIWELCSEYLGEEFYDHFRKLYDLRMQADYGSVSKFIEFNRDVLKEMIDKSKELIDKIKLKLGSKNEN